ncbi:MAG: hypothetical protein JNK72_21485 [Myxococcales bacterium]|nr:hypothetical protein [Myxococcales bacterium]
MGSVWWSMIVAPRRTALALRESQPDGDARTLVARLATFMLVLGGFVSLTTTGRLVPSQLVATAVAWSFLPALQALSLWAARRASGLGGRFVWAWGAYLAGHGPWMLLLLAVSAVCLVTRDAWASFQWLLAKGVLPAAVALTAAFSVWLTRCHFGETEALAPPLARRSTAVFYLTLVGLIVGYYTVIGELLPLLGVYP